MIFFSTYSSTALYGLTPTCAVLLLRYARLLVISGTDNAEANAVVLEVSAVVEPVVHLAVAAAVVIAAETVIAADAVESIPAPLPDVAAHVI